MTDEELKRIDELYLFKGKYQTDMEIAQGNIRNINTELTKLLEQKQEEEKNGQTTTTP